MQLKGDISDYQVRKLKMKGIFIVGSKAKVEFKPLPLKTGKF